MNSYLTRPGALAAIAAAALALAPGTAFGQRGASSSPAAPAETVEQAQPAPQAMQRGQMRGAQRDQMQRARTGDMSCGQKGEARAGREMQGGKGMGGQGMKDGAQLTERERLEQMREHMIAGMRRMAVRMTAVQNRILALDRGEPDSAPPVEMGRMGMNCMQGKAPTVSDEDSDEGAATGTDR